MQGNIIAVDIPIYRKGEMNFFQVNVPNDVKCITGIVAEIRGYSVAPTPGVRNIAGTVKLQTEQLSGICYSCQLFTDENAFKQSMTFAGSNMIGLYSLKVSGSTFRGIQPVRIPNTFVLFGCFEDNIGKLMDQDIAYHVNLLLYTEWN